MGFTQGEVVFPHAAGQVADSVLYGGRVDGAELGIEHHAASRGIGVAVGDFRPSRLFCNAPTSPQLILEQRF